MKILVLSDVHGCRDRLRDIVEAYAPVVDAVIFCGDGERDWASLNDLQCLRHSIFCTFYPSRRVEALYRRRWRMQVQGFGCRGR